MIKIIKSLLVLFTVFILLAPSCKKNEPKPVSPLPPITTTGKNTFGCYIDGEPFVAKVNFTLGGTSKVSCILNEETGELIFDGNNDENNTLKKVRVYSFIENKTGKYDMFSYGDWQYGYYNFNYEGEPCYNYKYNKNNLGGIEILYLDTIQNIISGTFNMQLINLDCQNDSLMEITDGRFDLTY